MRAVQACGSRAIRANSGQAHPVLRRSYPPGTWRAMHRTASQSFACPAMSPSIGKGVSKTESDSGKDPKIYLIVKSNLNVTVFCIYLRKEVALVPVTV